MKRTGADISGQMRRKAEAGFLVGPPKIGFTVIRTKDGARAVPDPAAAALVAQAFVEVAANGLSLRQVTGLLQRNGLSGKRGGPVSLPTVQRFLTDPYYADAGLVPRPLFDAVQDRLSSRRS